MPYVTHQKKRFSVSVMNAIAGAKGQKQKISLGPLIQYRGFYIHKSAVYYDKYLYYPLEDTADKGKALTLAEAKLLIDERIRVTE